MSEIIETEKDLLYSEAWILERTAVKSVLQFSMVDSTNNFAKELLQSEAYRKKKRLPGKLAFPVLICAREQSAGRGRGVKKWWTGIGALTFSLLLDLREHLMKREEFPAVSPLIARCVAETLQESLDRVAVKGNLEVHPPNDVYLNKKKICGVLIESPSPDAVILGIGINTNNRKKDIPESFGALPLTTFADETGKTLDNTEFLISLLGKIFAVVQ